MNIWSFVFRYLADSRRRKLWKCALITECLYLHVPNQNCMTTNVFAKLASFPNNTATVLALLKVYILSYSNLTPRANFHIFPTNLARALKNNAELQKYVECAQQRCIFVGNPSASAFPTAPAWTAKSYSRSLLKPSEFQHFADESCSSR